jgi:hypothetical protein
LSHWGNLASEYGVSNTQRLVIGQELARMSKKYVKNKLIRELQRKLPTHSLFETYQKDFLFYQQVLAQQPKDKNKIYSLHDLRFLSR